MNALTRIFKWLYTRSLNPYPAKFRASFSEEMQSVFAEVAHEAENNPGKLLAIFGREIRDWPGSVLREHLQARSKDPMNHNNLAWRPLNTKELLIGLTFFVVLILGNLVKLVFGYSIGNRVGSVLQIATLVFILTILIFGFIKGFPRWTTPYLGAVVIGFVMVLAVFPLWGFIASNSRSMSLYYTKTLAVRIQYYALASGFYWLVPIVALVLLILLLMIWPRTRPLAQRIRRDWTLLSFMIYSAVVFDLELVFEEYAYDEAWKIACRVCLALGAWIYFKNADPRKRILALLAGVTLTYWIAAIGKWVVLPLQSWGAIYGYDHWADQWGSTLAQWVWVMFFMLIPALLTLIPRPQESDPAPEENLAPA